MTGHDQFREGIKDAVLSGAFAGDFETHPVGTARRIDELEAEVQRLRAKLKPCRSMRDAVDDVAVPLMDN